jgi:predicted MPP superfamily phosphohydrolase
MAVTRRQVLTDLLVWSAAALATAGYAFAVEPGIRLSTVTHSLTPRGWPKGRKLRIAMLADPHMGEPLWPLSRLEEVVEKANGLGCDLIALMGDYEAGHKWVTKKVDLADTARVLGQLRAPLGVYSILGNHDWWVDMEAQEAGHGPILAHRELEKAGIRVLENDALKIGTGAEAFWLLGLGDQMALRYHKWGWRGVDDLPGTLAQIGDDAPAILLAHEPDIFPEVPDRVSLTLSGHTHGGQVRLFGWSPQVPSRYGNRYAYGHVREDGRDIIVSGGLGCSILPVRFGVPPEITVVELG